MGLLLSFNKIIPEGYIFAKYRIWTFEFLSYTAFLAKFLFLSCQFRDSELELSLMFHMALALVCISKTL
jgi:hypothetical protein